MIPPTFIPTEVSPAGDFARQLALLLGPAFNASPGTLFGADLLALGGALSGAHVTNLSSIAEAFADTAVQLLPELEAQYGLSVNPNLTIAQRQMRLVATIRSHGPGTPQWITSTLHTIDTTATVKENAYPLAKGAVPYTVFVWGVVIAAATFNNAMLYQQVVALVNELKPAHTQVNIGTNANFLCDDPNSLCDRDLLQK